jgi:Cupin domain.
MNLFDLANQSKSKEIINVLLKNESVQIEHIVSTGQKSPEGFWYNEKRAEFVALMQGEAILEYVDGTQAKLVAGDTLLIPPHKTHRVAYTSEEPACIWLCIYYNE